MENLRPRTEGLAAVPDADEVLADVPGTEGVKDMANGEEAINIKETDESEPVKAT